MGFRSLVGSEVSHEVPWLADSTPSSGLAPSGRFLATPLRGRVGLWSLDAPEGHDQVEVLEVEDVVGVVDGVDPKGFVVNRRRSELQFVAWTD